MARATEDRKLELNAEDVAKIIENPMAIKGSNGYGYRFLSSIKEGETFSPKQIAGWLSAPEDGLTDIFLATYLCTTQDFPDEIITEWRCSQDRLFRRAAYCAMARKKDVPYDILERGLSDTNMYACGGMYEALENKTIPAPVLKDWILTTTNREGRTIIANYIIDASMKRAMPYDLLQIAVSCVYANQCIDLPTDIAICWADEKQEYRVRAAAYRSAGRFELPVPVIASGLEAKSAYIRDSALRACKGNANIPPSVIREWAKTGNNCFLSAALLACCGREGFADVIQSGLRHAPTRAFALLACGGKEEFLGTILSATESVHSFRSAAYEALRAFENPTLVLAELAKNDSDSARIAEQIICKEHGLAIKPYRSAEPPRKVYKKCLNNVIVEAEIPEDAQIRGLDDTADYGRADKAVITGVYGDFLGVPMGVSAYDYSTTYSVGDVVRIPDFDVTAEAYGTGFHFFRTRTQAEMYVIPC